MNGKTLILVIILSFLIGVLIFFFTMFSSKNSKPLLGVSVSSSTATPTPKPTLPPLPANANLSEELNKISVPDFEDDFENLKDNINNF